VNALNLSRHPFRNERLPTLLLSVAGLVLVAVTVRHAAAAWDLLPGRSRDVLGQVVALETEAARLGAESAELQRLAATPDEVSEWLAVKGLVDRRAFSWTGLFAALEKGLPPGVRLVSVSPHEGPDGIELALAAVGRDRGDALALLKALKSRDEFEAAFLNGWDEKPEGMAISCTVRYVPRAAVGQGVGERVGDGVGDGVGEEGR
jgi:Tfp pilus assembly protein PilN